jgi:hypothetical protein
MSKNKKIFSELNLIMTEALLKMQVLITSDATQKEDFLSAINLFLIGVISTAADMAEVISPGASSHVYTEIEAASKEGGLRAVRDAQAKGRNYSVSNIGPNDFSEGMNYLGQELGITLFKHIHDLPTPLRKPEMLLRGIEVLLGNVLDQKFGESFGEDPHKILDSLCEHVHMALKDLKTRREVAKAKEKNNNIVMGVFESHS